MREHNEDIKWNNGVIEVRFDYTPADPGVRTYPNGDPGYPPSPEEFNINSVWYKGVEITDLFDSDDFEAMEERIVEIRNDRYEDYEP